MSIAVLRSVRSCIKISFQLFSVGVGSNFGFWNFLGSFFERINLKDQNRLKTWFSLNLNFSLSLHLSPYPHFPIFILFLSNIDSIPIFRLFINMQSTIPKYAFGYYLINYPYIIIHIHIDVLFEL